MPQKFYAIRYIMLMHKGVSIPTGCVLQCVVVSMRFFLLQVFRLGKHLFITLEQLHITNTAVSISDSLQLYSIMSVTCVNVDMFTVDIAHFYYTLLFHNRIIALLLSQHSTEDTQMLSLSLVGIVYLCFTHLYIYTDVLSQCYYYIIILILQCVYNSLISSTIATRLPTT